MPVYDYKCLSCSSRIDDEFVHNRDHVVVCPICDIQMIRLFPNRITVHVFPPEGIYLEHVSADGETFHSKSEMKRYAKENNLELGALL